MTTLQVISLAIDFEKLKKEKGARVKFPVYMNQEMMNTSIEALELSVRATNCLHRYGYHTLGDLLENITSGEDLAKLRNCGKSSIMEIMLTIMCYQFMQLDVNGQKSYVNKMREMNW